MLAGAPPFWGDEITEVMLKHIEAKRPDPRNMVADVSQHSADLVTRMMSVRPDKRPFNADQVIEEITALLPALPKLFNATPAPMPVPRKKQSEIARIPAQPQPSRDRAQWSASVAPTSVAQPDESLGFWDRVKSWFGF